MGMKRGLRNSILLSALTYRSEHWTWSKAQQSKVRAVEMSYLRGACGVNRRDGVSNESCGMTGRGSRVGCGVVEWVKRSTLRWFGHIERMENEEFVKVYPSSVKGPNMKGKPLGRLGEGVRE